MLLSHTTEYNTKGVLHHMLLDLAAHFFDKLDDMEDPRLFTTHLPLHHLPDHHVKNGYKIIYLNRNPKDRWVSNYTFLNGKLGIPDWTWNEFFDKMILKDDLQGGWFNFTKGFEKAAKVETSNILPVKYEDLKQHPFSTIKKMAEFINVSYTDDIIREIIEKCSFVNIKQHKYDSSRMIDPKHKSTLFRKGVIGDWKNWFTVAQNEKFDEMYREEMKDCTHWCHEILSMLLSQSVEYNTKGSLHHMYLEFAAYFMDKLDEVDDPRLFTIHFPLHHLPTHHVKNGYKMIYLNRNPKDRWVSNYTFLHGKLGIPDWTWDEFFDNMIIKDDLYEGWFNYTREFEKAAHIKKANILPIKYEDLKLHPFSTIKKMADFINVSQTDDFIREIIEKCSFDNIKKHKYDSTRIIDPKQQSTLFRKGVIGDWKNWFTVAQNEKFDEIYKEKMKDCDVDFIYEQ
ncbi:SULT1 [Mytilus edulis]|uniref:SULT1 n=1 Tax=Mytilus edulis TaxID=6550 RepID=A0A8S3TUA0_MYTED|nr:SULT1 [Mytilus edulis]